MNSRTFRLVAGLGGLLASAAFGFGIVQSALAQGERPGGTPGEAATQAAVPAAQTIPMEQILADLKAQGYGEVYEIERDDGKYEVKARNREGQMVELELDARTGATLKSERERDREHN